MNSYDFTYSSDALYIRDTFLGQYTNIDFYFEDSGKEYFYQQLLEKLIGKKLLSYSDIGIFCLGGKQALYKKHEEFAEGKITKKAIFIADGDFDRFIELDMINSDNFIYLEKYNIESYLFDIEAINDFLRGNFKITAKEIQTYINIELWYNKTLKDLSDFFLLFAIQKKLIPEVKIFDFDIIDKKGDIILSKYEDKKNKILKKITEEKFNEELNKLKNKMQSEYNNDYSYIVCGKHLFRSLKNKIRSISRVGHSFRDDDFQYYILGKMKIDSLNYVKEKITKYLSNNL